MAAVSAEVSDARGAGPAEPGCAGGRSAGPGPRAAVGGQQRQPPATSPRTSSPPRGSPGRTLVTLTSVSDDDLGDELTVAWEIEPGREIVPATQLPAVTRSELGRPAAARRLPRRRPLGHCRQRRHPHARRPRSAPASRSRTTSSNRSPARSRCRGSTCSSPTTWASARRSRPAWSSRRCCSGTGRGA